METKVKAHRSHSKRGKIEEIHAHEMRVNDKVHKKHVQKLEEEARALEEQAHEHVRHVLEHKEKIKVKV